MSAGTQGGKTSFQPWWMWREIQRRGAGDYLAVTSSFDLFKLKLLPEFRTVFEEILHLGRFWAQDEIMELTENLIPGGQFKARQSSDPMWARIILRSAVAKGGLESATAKAATLDECGQEEWTIETWEAIQRRVSLYTGRVLGGTTLYNEGWIKSQWYERWENGDPDYDVIQFPSVFNPNFPREEYERAKRTLPPWRFKMFYEGKFSKPEGLIYAAFEESMLEDDWIPPADWYRIIGVDFGGANTAFLIAAQDPDTELWHIYDEYLMGNLPTAEHCAYLGGQLAGSSDWDAFGGAPGETQYRADWYANGIEVQEPSVSNVEVGISRGVQLFKENKVRVCRGLARFRHDLANYRRRLGEDSKPTDEILNKNMYHMADCYRAMATAMTESAGVDVLAVDTRME